MNQRLFESGLQNIGCSQAVLVCSAIDIKVKGQTVVDRSLKIERNQMAQKFLALSNQDVRSIFNIPTEALIGLTAFT